MTVINFCRPNVKRRISNGEKINWIHNSLRSRYIIKCINSYPYWITKAHFKSIEDELALMKVLYKEPYTIDHIVPISHPYVCGLSVPWNMRVITKRLNDAKKNKFHLDQIELELPEPDKQKELL